MASMIRNAVLGFSLSLALVAACGGDVDPDPDAGEVSDETAGGDSTDDDSGSGDTSGDTGSGTQNACGAGDVNMDDACEVCIATQCTAEALACCQADGCLDVVRCAAEKGCGGIDCYTPEMCQAEIDIAGIDVASNQATQLGECALESCAAECDQEGAAP